MMSAVRGLTRRLPILIPFFWLLVFFLTPFFIVLQISFAEFQYGQPPYVPNFRKVEGVGDFFNQLQMMTLYSYEILLSDNLYWKAFLSSDDVVVFFSDSCSSSSVKSGSSSF